MVAMQCEIKSDFPVTNEAAKKATGKTLDEWYKLIDAAGGPKLGRRAINVLLYSDNGVDAWWATTIAVEYEKHKDIKKKDGLYEGYFICSTKTIAAPLDQVYAAWADTAQLARWFGAGSKAAVVDGGAYSNKDGDRGSYLRVRPNKDLRFTWENPALSAPTLVDVSFEDKGKGKTGLLVNHTRIQSRAEADGLRTAWSAALDKLKALLES
jgi:uncharacterized protein YndB with AHSA1/START domain